VVGQYSISPNAAALKQRFETALVAGSIAILIAAAITFSVRTARRFGGTGEVQARVWFYDQTANRLYPAPRSLISPDGNNDARVRAVVIGFQGLGNEVSQLKIAYLEKYSAELKALLERAEAAHAAKLPFTEKIPSQNSAYFQDNTLVKRPGEASWHSLASEEARQIMAEWRKWHGPAGQPPIVSVPSIR